MSKRTLEQVVQAFALWRLQKTKPHTVTPIELRQQAVELVNDFTPSQIAKALGLSGMQFKKWCQELQSATPSAASEPQQSDFLSLPLPLGNPTSPSLELELTLPNATQVRICGELSVDLLRVLLQEARLS